LVGCRVRVADDGLCAAANQPIDEGDDRTAAIVFEGMQVRTLVGVLQTLVQMRFPADEKGIKEFGERILKAKKQRDIFGHLLIKLKQVAKLLQEGGGCGWHRPA